MVDKESDISTISNLEIHNNECFVVVSVNTKIYAMDIVYSACYVFIDKAYVQISGNPDTEVLVELRYKGIIGDLEILGRDFNNELLSYAVFKLESEKGRETKDSIIRKSLETNNETLECEEDCIDDPLGIAKPWEETHKNE
jgi:His-Xaa-Ser system protein HxsD